MEKNNPMDDLLAFFRKSYGENYVGDKEFTDRFINKATNIVEHKEQNTEAIAIISNKRIIAIGTDGENRMTGLIGLFDKCKQQEPDCFITVGIKHEAVKHACRQAGMIRNYNQVEIEEMLQISNPDESYFIIINVYGLVVFRTDRSYYYQEVYK